MKSHITDVMNGSWEERAEGVEKKESSARKSDFKIHRHREQRLEIPTDAKSHVTLETSRKEKIVGKIVNISRFGARIEVNSTDLIVSIGEDISNIKLILDETVLYDGAATIVTQIQNSSQYGITLQGNGVDFDQVNAILHLNPTNRESSNIGSVKTILELSNHINPLFKALVADLNALFQDLKFKLNLEEEHIKTLAVSPNHQKRMEEHTINLALALYREDIHRLFGQFNQFVQTLDGDSTILHKRYFRANFHPAVLGSPFVNRSWSKPLGHAGDYGLMVMLYEYDDVGTNLFEKFFHRFCCHEPAAVANKNRVELLSDLVSQEFTEAAKKKTGEFKITSIACGPAKEVELFLTGIEDTKTDVTAICLDQEGNALDYAIQRLRKVSSKNKNIRSLFLKEDAILGLIRKKPFTTEIQNSSVITCAGMYDYVSDRLASKLIEAMYDLVAPGGLLLIGNVSDQNPDRFSMDYFAEWNLILRSPADLEKLVPASVREHSGNAVSVLSEPLGLNLFLKIRKPDGGK